MSRVQAARPSPLASLHVLERLDDTLQAVYRSAGVPMAPVASAFELENHDPVAWSGGGTVPDDVAQACALTWMCDPPPLGHNPHPDDAGYRTIALAIADAAAVPSDRADADSRAHTSSSTTSTTAMAGAADAATLRQGT